MRVETLALGDRFLCSSGRIWTFVRRHGSHAGVYCVIGQDGEETCFAGCAEVVIQ